MAVELAEMRPADGMGVTDKVARGGPRMPFDE
jgi:hypothetical protein